MDEIDEVVRAVSIPVQAVGGLSIQQAIECPSRGAPLVVLGAPLVIDADAFTPVTGAKLHAALSESVGDRASARPSRRRRNSGLKRMNQQGVVQFALEPLAVELREVTVPEIGDTDVLLRVGAVSVCGSDVHQAYNTHSWPVNVPVILGHEFAGTVAKAGRAVTGFREGDRVVSETAAEVCGECMLCRTGLYNLCPTRKGFGYGIDGAMASYVKVPARCLHRDSRTRCRSSSPASRNRTPWPTTRCA